MGCHVIEESTGEKCGCIIMMCSCPNCLKDVCMYHTKHFKDCNPQKKLIDFSQPSQDSVM